MYLGWWKLQNGQNSFLGGAFDAGRKFPEFAISFWIFWNAARVTGAQAGQRKPYENRGSSTSENAPRQLRPGPARPCQGQPDPPKIY